MTAPAKLLIVLGENDSAKLILPSGIPKSVDKLKIELERQCGVSGHYRLQYMDIDFDNAFVNLTSTADLQDKGTIRVIIEPIEPIILNLVATTAPHTPLTASSDESCSLADTDVLSSPESTSSASTSSASVLRSQAWPASFPIPEFSYDVQMQLMKANQEYQSNCTLLTPSPKLKSDILDALASEILKYKAYPSSAQFDDVAQALILKHPCLKEKGSLGGFGGWKISLKFKMGNYRTKLRNLRYSELSINSLKHRQGDKCAGPNQVKKPKRAEVNFCPDYPAGENKESQERERLALLSEVNKKDNNQTLDRFKRRMDRLRKHHQECEARYERAQSNVEVIKDQMEKTFALRRYEVVQDMPFITEFKSRWPALFSEREICAEFMRITTIPLIPKFMSQLDKYITKLPGVFRKKGGVAGRTINDTLTVIDQNDTIATRRACHLKALAVYLNEDPGKLMKEYIDVNCDNAVRDMNQTVIGIYVAKHEGADVDDPPEDIGIVVEGVQVLQDLKDVANACALLFGVMYCLNLSYPSDLKYTFEFLQKILMELDVHRLSNKIQILKNKLLA